MIDMYTDKQPYMPSAAQVQSQRLNLKWMIAILLAALLGGVVGGGTIYFALQRPLEVAAQPTLEKAAVVPVSLDVNTAITDAVVEVGPTVVTVLNHLPPRRTFFGTASGRTASGSGVIVSSDGHVVTNNHVVEGAQSLEIVLADGTMLPAQLVGVDPYADLAVVKVDSEMVPIADWGNSDALKPGETVIAIGSPLGDFKNTVTVGVVSATERSIDVDRNYMLEGLIQTDAAINQGNSGGPLVNLAGQIVGINTLVVRGGSSGAVTEGLGFAIPSNTARALTEQIINKGYVSRPFLGVRWGWITPALAEQYNLPVRYGAYLSEVTTDSPAAAVGLRQGDIIIAMNDQTLDEDHPFINQLFQYEPGEIVTFTIMRGERELKIEVSLTERHP